MRNDVPQSESGRGGPGAEPILWVAVTMLALPVQAYAYLDPGTGSLIIQAVIGFILALRLTSKIWYRRSKRFLLSIFRPNSSPSNSGE